MENNAQLTAEQFANLVRDTNIMAVEHTTIKKWRNVPLIYLLDAIRLLALNDENARYLLDGGVVDEILQKIFQSPGDFSEKEQLGALDIYHTLLQSKFGGEMLKPENDCSTLIDKNLNTGSGKVKDRAEDILNFRNHPINPFCSSKQKTTPVEGKKPQPAVTKRVNLKPAPAGQKVNKKTQSKKNPIFISYQHNYQNFVKELHDFLVKNDCNVCVDFEHLRGKNLLDFMAESVEQASIVIICYSESYFTSANCRSEAEFARRKRKPIVWIQVEEKYEPGGWLGFLMGMDFYIETAKYQNKVEDVGEKALERIYDLLTAQQTT